MKQIVILCLLTIPSLAAVFKGSATIKTTPNSYQVLMVWNAYCQESVEQAERDLREQAEKIQEEITKLVEKQTLSVMESSEYISFSLTKALPSWHQEFKAKTKKPLCEGIQTKLSVQLKLNLLKMREPLRIIEKIDERLNNWPTHLNVLGEARIVFSIKTKKQILEGSMREVYKEQALEKALLDADEQLLKYSRYCKITRYKRKSFALIKSKINGSIDLESRGSDSAFSSTSSEQYRNKSSKENCIRVEVEVSYEIDSEWCLIEDLKKILNERSSHV